MTLAINVIVHAALPVGAFAIRGALHPLPEDSVPNFADGTPVRTIVLLGWTGGRQWPVFEASPEARDGQPHPLDRWSRRLIDAAASRLGALPLYPFGGPPHHDFQNWALRAEPVARSPIGLLIHPEWGLWHAWRGALGLRDRLVLPDMPRTPSPCETCADRPCLGSCPVAAFSVGGYDIGACGEHLAKADGAACVARGCAARDACPIRPIEACSPTQRAFHMTAFRRGLNGKTPPGVR